MDLDKLPEDKRIEYMDTLNNMRKTLDLEPLTWDEAKKICEEETE